MPDIESLRPQLVQEHVHRGYKRLQNFRNARVAFLRGYVGPYYDRSSGIEGNEALNMTFHAIKSILPNIVMNFPEFSMESKFLASREYGKMLAMALDLHTKQHKLRDVYRVAIVDALFTLGILKTALGESDTVQVFDANVSVDNGEVFTENVDFDNFVVDPDSKEHMFRDARWMGDRLVVAREDLLASGLYDNELVEQLPSLDDGLKNDKASDLSMRGKGSNQRFIDEVEIFELWVPGSNTLITVPGSKDTTFDDYLRVDSYYGPKEGPYTLLSFSPPVPGNPLPVPLVGVWRDLHVRINEMATKIMDQAGAQKDVMLYTPSGADDAEAVKDAKNLEAVATDNPDSVQIRSFGGQAQSNELHIGQLQNWFNLMASNPQAISGERLDADSATEARILQGNANIGLEDNKDLVYLMVQDEARKRMWYFHTDPFIEVPLIRREQVPAQFATGPLGEAVMVTPPTQQEVQVFLTPEARRHDYLDFTLTVMPESMGRQDRTTKMAEMMDFAVKIMPAAMQVALTAQQLGQPFDVSAYVQMLAEARGIKWLDSVWGDPLFQFKMQQLMLQGPSVQNSEGKAGQAVSQNPLGATLQNGQPGQVGGGAIPQQKQENQQAQLGANFGQSQLRSEGFG